MRSDLKSAKEAIVDRIDFEATPGQIITLKCALLGLGLMFSIE